MIQRSLKLCDFLVHSVCFLQNFFSIRTKISVHSLALWQILHIFTVNFQRYFRSKYKFCKIFEGTRSLNLHLHEPGVLARTRAISGPGRARRETISSHLKISVKVTGFSRLWCCSCIETFLMSNKCVLLTGHCWKDRSFEVWLADSQKEWPLWFYPSSKATITIFHFTCYR